MKYIRLLVLFFITLFLLSCSNSIDAEKISESNINTLPNGIVLSNEELCFLKMLGDKYNFSNKRNLYSENNTFIDEMK